MSNIISFDEITSKTPIKNLPEIINKNNEYIEVLCSSIYKRDSSNNIYSIIGVNTIANIKANSGHFQNIYFDELNDYTANSNAFIGIKTDHKNAINRFSENYNGDILMYAHDAASIIFDSSTGSVYDKIISYDVSIKNINDKCALIDESIKTLTEKYDKLTEKLNIENQVITTDETEVMPATYSLRRSVSANSETANTDSELVYAHNQNANSYTYSNKIYSSSDISQCIYEWDKYDIENNIKFRYYKITDNYYTKINNQYKCALNTYNVGQETTLIIDKNANNDLYIRLSFDGDTYEYVKIKYEDIDLARITLVCIKKTIYGPVWYVKNYNGNITFEKIEK